MKKAYYLFLIILLVSSCKEQEKVDFNFVTSKFKENADNIKVVQYDNHRIDSSMAQNVFWNHKGTAILERKENDTFHGFSFYGKRNDVDKEYLYDNGNGFEISPRNEKYELEHPYGVIGSPGGQMTVKSIFKLDSIYESGKLIEKDDKYILKYTYKPDTVYNITDQTKVVELRKEDFFPTKITYRSNALGKNTMYQYNLSNIKINQEVKTSISDIKNSISDYKVIQKKITAPNPVLYKEFPKIKLPNLKNKDQIVYLEKGKFILIDFWEVWCGPCIQSFPKVEELNRKYQDYLQIVGIVTESKESAVKLIEKKGVTFLNLFGDKNVHKDYQVNSYPRYFLIDKNGIIQNEYFGFSSEIEKDIKNMIGE